MRFKREEKNLLKGSFSNETEIWLGLKVWIKMERGLSIEGRQHNQSYRLRKTSFENQFNSNEEENCKRQN